MKKVLTNFNVKSLEMEVKLLSKRWASSENARRAAESKHHKFTAKIVKNSSKDERVVDPITKVNILGEEQDLNPGDLKGQVLTTAESKWKKSKAIEEDPITKVNILGEE